jgi:hypothetical protein
MAEIAPDQAAIVRRLHAIEQVLARDSDRSSISVNEWLVGAELPCIYEEFLRKPSGVSRNNQKPSGPMVRFIMAVLKASGIQFADESIARAYTKCDKLRESRREVRQHDMFDRRTLVVDELSQRGCLVAGPGLLSPYIDLLGPGAKTARPPLRPSSRRKNRPHSAN